jgi:hypothetical protein
VLINSIFCKFPSAYLALISLISYLWIMLYLLLFSSFITSSIHRFLIIWLLTLQNGLLLLRLHLLHHVWLML